MRNEDPREPTSSELDLARRDVEPGPFGKTRKRTSLLRDESGATMVMGVFMASLLVGVMYYVYGVAQTLVHRERMQDAADAGAFSAGVIHARAMNTVAMMNLGNAGWATVVATLEAATGMFQAALDVANAYCSSGDPELAAVYCPEVAQLTARVGQTQGQLGSARGQAQGFYSQARSAVSGLSTGAANASRSRIQQFAGTDYRRVTEQGFLAPSSARLAIEDESSYDYICGSSILLGLDRQESGAHHYGVLYWSQTHVAVTNISAGPNSIPESQADQRWLEGAVGQILRQQCQSAPFQRTSEQTMGGQGYQLQAYIQAEPRYRWVEDGVRIAAWGRTTTNRTDDDLRPAQEVSFAQAEYYLEPLENPNHQDETRHPRAGRTPPNRGQWRQLWAWTPAWRARYRRFRFDQNECPVSNSCNAVQRLNELIVH